MDARPGFRPSVVPPESQPSTQAPSGAGQQLADIDARLAELPDLAIADQVEVFADIHQRLTAALAGTGGAATSASDPARPSDSMPPPRGR